MTVPGGPFTHIAANLTFSIYAVCLWTSPDKGAVGGVWPSGEGISVGRRGKAGL